MPSRLLYIAAVASLAGPASASTACRTEQARHDRVEIRCPWPAGAQGLRFEARFAGSHDDTQATLSSSMNGAPLTCAPGSKTSIDGQDEGEVTLDCRLARPPATGASAELHFQLRWYHARYSGFDLRVEP